MHHIVILGAGFGGLELATRLSESVGDDVRVTVIDESEAFTFGFEKLEIMFGRRTSVDVRCLYRDFVKDAVEFRQERITKIDPATRTVETDASTYESDFLVVALGADYAPEVTQGFVENGHEFYSVAGAERTSEALASFTGGRIVVAILRPPFKCPPAPYEATLLLHDYLTQRDVREKTDIRVITPMDSPIPVSKETSEAIVRGLEERGITYTPAERVVRLDPGEAELASGERVPYDLFLGIPAHRVPDVVEASGLTKDGTDGWIHVDPTNLRTPFDGVYAIGDNADAPVPRAGVFAEGAALVVADDLIARIKGADAPGRFEGKGICYVEFGGGKVGKVNVNFLGGPTPQAPFTPPSEELAREKAAFATSRRARWFGKT